MSSKFLFQLILVILSLVVIDASRHRRHRSNNKHRIFVAAPQRFSKNFLEVYAQRSIEEFNKQTKDSNKYVLLGVVNARAAEETKSLDLVLRFGRTRCQKTEDRYFCQTAEDIVDTRTYKVAIRRLTPQSQIEYTFQQVDSESLETTTKKETKKD
ncbi:hypothetical protein M3Y95_00296300 [Aphelenchoides besseyi]|nr:hypothetical protein M3Y95_00296300 [Aphelenchoides besseyi]